jgi:hypothetical protein
VVTCKLFSGSTHLKVLDICGYPSIVKVGDPKCLDFVTFENSLYKDQSLNVQCTEQRNMFLFIITSLL